MSSDAEAISRAFHEWLDAWFEGEDHHAAALRPHWDADRQRTLQQRIDHRRALLSRLADPNARVSVTLGGAAEEYEPIAAQNGGGIFGSVGQVYELIDTAGQGGQGEVLLAFDPGLQRKVAIKRPLGEWTAQSLRRFEFEARAVASLNHDAIVEVYQFGSQNERPFIVFEYCAGGTLEQRLKSFPTWDATSAARLLLVLAGGISAAHQKNIIHCDLKPANILFGDDDAPKIADFGFSNRLDENGNPQLAHIGGTRDYMAPEVISLGLKSLGPAIDVYSLGAVLYRLLVGKPPTWRVSVGGEVIKPPRLVNPRIPPDLEAVCLKCLSRRPQDRYPSAQHLCDDLKRFLDHKPVTARPLGLGELAVRTLALRRLDPHFYDWGRVAFAMALFMVAASHLTVWDPLFGTLFFYGGMVWLVAHQIKNTREYDERRLAVILGFNLAACSIINVVLGNLSPDVETNVWAPSAVINGTMFAFVGIMYDWRFYLYALVFFAAGIGLSLVSSDWACLLYGYVWAVLLVPLGAYFRLTGKPQ